MIKYVSDVTNKSYDSAEEAEKAEKEYTTALAKKEADKVALTEARKADAKAIKDLYAQRADLNKQINKKLDEFCKKYGSYHATYTGHDALNMIDSMFDDFFDHFWF